MEKTSANAMHTISMWFVWAIIRKMPDNIKFSESILTFNSSQADRLPPDYKFVP